MHNWKTYDGHDFINEAIDKGAVLIVSERKLHSFDTIGLIQIDSPRDALAKDNIYIMIISINFIYQVLQVLMVKQLHHLWFII